MSGATEVRSPGPKSGDDTAARKRRPRFRRATPVAFRLTDGDLTILELLARHRFLRSTHIAALVGRSLDRANDRLRKLFDGGLVDRPRAQLDRFPDAGSAPMVYALADRGARLLLERGSGEHAAVLTRKNAEVGRPFIEHQLAIADFMVALELEVRGRDDLVLVRQDELEEEIRARGISGSPFKMSSIGEGGGPSFTIPDLAFALRYSNGSRRCFLVEIDRGTMPVKRASQMQTSIAKKLRTYLDAYRAGDHLRLGWRTLRVLVVTTSETRRKWMRFEAAQLSSSFMVTTMPLLFAVARQSDPGGILGYSWQAAEGDWHSLA